MAATINGVKATTNGATAKLSSDFLDVEIELTKAGEAFMKSDGITWPLFYTGVYYLLFVGVLTILFNYIERRLSYFR